MKDRAKWNISDKGIKYKMLTESDNINVKK